MMNVITIQIRMVTIEIHEELAGSWACVEAAASPLGVLWSWWPLGLGATLLRVESELCHHE